MRLMLYNVISVLFFFFQAEDGIRDKLVTGVQTCALPISWNGSLRVARPLQSCWQSRRGNHHSASIARPNGWALTSTLTWATTRPAVPGPRNWSTPWPLCCADPGAATAVSCQSRAAVASSWLRSEDLLGLLLAK